MSNYENGRCCLFLSALALNNLKFSLIHGKNTIASFAPLACRTICHFCQYMRSPLENFLLAPMTRPP